MMTQQQRLTPSAYFNEKRMKNAVEIRSSCKFSGHEVVNAFEKEAGTFTWELTHLLDSISDGVWQSV